MPWNPPLNSTRIDPGNWYVIEDGFNLFGHWGDFYVRIEKPIGAPSSQRLPLLRLNSSVLPWESNHEIEFGQIRQFHRWGNYFKSQVYNPPGGRPIYLELNPPP